MTSEGQARGIFPSPFTVPYMTRWARRWAKSGATFGAAGFLAVSFFCDWKDVLQYVPVINDRFKVKDDE